MAATPPSTRAVTRSLEDHIRHHAALLGFDSVGFSPADLPDNVLSRLREFVAAGRHGTMSWMAERMEARAQPRHLWPEVKSVISLGLSYAPEGDALATLHKPDCGNISVYARHRDYHDVVKGRLKQLANQIIKYDRDAQVKVFVDTAPVAEKPLAAQAGLGWQGKHTNLVSRDAGSWLFIGTIYTTAQLEPSPHRAGKCGNCARCLDVCPTRAFPQPYALDARRCISYLTIEHHGPIPMALRPLIGNRIYGCDDCLAVCPWNRFAQMTAEMKLTARPDLVAPSLQALSRLDDTAFRTTFSGSPIKRIGRNRFIRNVLIAIGNAGRPALLPETWRLQHDTDPVIAEAARWAGTRLRSREICAE
ncbi:tRNA epoxyqueuosine(34) reductase QueG [Candidatus Kirkpatrickella diaphorinae]|uniref:Epoxyqueuosine reductase n=1 Tax=Candidatus Kirkpatrickella diaphorinae TaxID=2984322 RepID=A0ABY6GJE5_9PROT|nr:tRNA epoxyqueuosine(34) reductase QueG [Candidatus Kirkpatrickella diaphorinae]UYH51389.1 tRNA epoxyqueuosine(34) reductase QueG [Candidatus Kirkpatrickella diaphorinae]